MQLTVKLEGVKEALRTFDYKIVKKAARRSLSETISAAKTMASKAIRERYNIAKVNVDKYLSKSLPKELSATLTAKASKRTATLPLILFKVKQPGVRIARRVGEVTAITRTKAKKDYVQVQIRKGGKWITFKRAFIAKMPTGYIGIFERKGKERLPIMELKTIDIPLMFAQRGVMEKTIKRAVEKWNKDFPQRLEWLMKQ